MHHLLAKLELEGISIFSFKAVTRHLTEKIGLRPWGEDPFNSVPVTQTYKQAHRRLVYACIQIYLRVRAHTHEDAEREHKHGHPAAAEHAGYFLTLAIQFAMTSRALHTYLYARSHVLKYQHKHLFVFPSVSVYSSSNEGVTSSCLSKEMRKKTPRICFLC